MLYTASASVPQCKPLHNAGFTASPCAATSKATLVLLCCFERRYRNTMRHTLCHHAQRCTAMLYTAAPWQPPCTIVADALGERAQRASTRAFARAKPRAPIGCHRAHTMLVHSVRCTRSRMHGLVRYLTNSISIDNNTRAMHPDGIAGCNEKATIHTSSQINSAQTTLCASSGAKRRALRKTQRSTQRENTHIYREREYIYIYIFCISVCNVYGVYVRVCTCMTCMKCTRFVSLNVYDVYATCMAFMASLCSI